MAKFEKGHKKLGGRSEGATNKTTRQLRETISDFLTDNFEKIEKDFNKLSPKERAKVYCDLLQYGLPKLQSVDLKIEEPTEIIMQHTIIHKPDIHKTPDGRVIKDFDKLSPKET